MLLLFVWMSCWTLWTSPDDHGGGRSEERGAPAWALAPLFSLLDLRFRCRRVLHAPPAARRHERYLAELSRRYRRRAPRGGGGDAGGSAGGRRGARPAGSA